MTLSCSSYNCGRMNDRQLRLTETELEEASNTGRCMVTDWLVKDAAASRQLSSKKVV